mmetsp:Transcript_1910/g.11756  ORF Transcript_1910/g.11756 Transcript_1910/m.11756 type:complete len:81 (+) Transcript_1910:3822-4064(+)
MRHKWPWTKAYNARSQLTGIFARNHQKVVNETRDTWGDGRLTTRGADNVPAERAVRSLPLLLGDFCPLTGQSSLPHWVGM